MGEKRMSDGEEKHPKRARTGVAPSNDTPPGAQAPRSSVAPSTAPATANETRNPKKRQLEQPHDAPVDPKQPRAPFRKQDRKKLPRLPHNASVTKRPLHHPAIPTPFASSEHPKTLYISHSTPFIPTLKRMRRLLLEISKRQVQSQAAHMSRHRQQGHNRRPLVSNGRLAPEDVEREIAEEGRDKGGGGSGEEVFVKATGRAIERALRIGVHFQGESDCRVRVETGSVMAVDDIEVRHDEDEKGGDDSSKINKEVPETRFRMVSSVTVAVGLR